LVYQRCPCGHGPSEGTPRPHGAASGLASGWRDGRRAGGLGRRCRARTCWQAGGGMGGAQAGGEGAAQRAPAGMQVGRRAARRQGEGAAERTPAGRWRGRWGIVSECATPVIDQWCPCERGPSEGTPRPHGAAKGYHRARWSGCSGCVASGVLRPWVRCGARGPPTDAYVCMCGARRSVRECAPTGTCEPACKTTDPSTGARRC
jgi:hypothetical protein